jgi:hypothetical protein
MPKSFHALDLIEFRSDFNGLNSAENNLKSPNQSVDANWKTDIVFFKFVFSIYLEVNS